MKYGTLHPQSDEGAHHSRALGRNLSRQGVDPDGYARYSSNEFRLWLSGYGEMKQGGTTGFVSLKGGYKKTRPCIMIF